MSYFDGKKVLVTGGAGFIGSHTVEELLRRAPKARVTVVDDLSHGKRGNLKAVVKDVKVMTADLRTKSGALKACRGQEVVLHLAAKVAGVGYNSTHQAEMFRENMTLSMSMMEAARASGVGRMLVVSSACVYAGGAPVPTTEEQGFVGKPEAANEGYGFAKRMAEFLGQMYAREYGLEVAIVRPYNAYGPRDRYGKADSHVIAALIWRALKGENPMLVWGDGKPTRSFCYVEDLARGLLDTAEKYAVADPLNIGTDEEVSIGELARLVLELAGSKAKLTFDASKPAGQMRRTCGTAKAAEKAGYRARVPLREGLRKSIDWCREHYFK
jgi:GDP-L-fucose synthase